MVSELSVKMPGLSCLHTVGSLSCAHGGPSRTVTALCDALARAGAGVEILTQNLWCGSADDSTVSPVLARVSAIPAFPSKIFRISNAARFHRVLERRCASGHTQVLHDHGLWLPNNHAAAAAARCTGVPLIVSPRGMLEPWALNHRAWKKRLAWWLYQCRDLKTADVLHATAEQEAENLRRLGLQQPIAVIPNGVDPTGFKARLPRVDNERVALFLSRIHPKKGLLELVDAWKQTKPSGWKVVVAGPDEGRHLMAVETAIHNAGMDTLFEFVGPVEGETKTGLYRNADVFLLPSFSENFGVVVAEALACEVPVITTKGTPWQGLERHRCGWWIDIGVEPLAAAIRLATSLSDDERLVMGRRGRAYVEREFGWSGIAEQMLGVYQWVLGRGAKPGCVVTD